MNLSVSTETIHENDGAVHQRHRGFIVFCEKRLRYEKGVKAWIFLGPYLLGALGLDRIIDTGHAQASTPIWPWIGFLAYLVLFPPIWQRFLKFVASKKAAPDAPDTSSAVQLP